MSCKRSNPGARRRITLFVIAMIIAIMACGSEEIDPLQVANNYYATMTEDTRIRNLTDTSLAPSLAAYYTAYAQTEVVLTGTAIGSSGMKPTDTPTNTSWLNIWDFIESSRGTLENYGTDMIGLVHLGDQVLLRRPITVRLRVHRHEFDGGPELQVTEELVQIAYGATWSYYLDEASADHPDNWDASIQLISINR